MVPHTPLLPLVKLRTDQVQRDALVDCHFLTEYNTTLMLLICVPPSSTVAVSLKLWSASYVSSLPMYRYRMA